MALVIGNANYQHVAPLQNAGNDADDMASTLADLGFSVYGDLNLTLEGMRTELNVFRSAAQSADAVLIYFAGHGVELDKESFLIPVEADIDYPGQVAYQAVALGEFEAAAEDTRAPLTIFILDACRNNPFANTRSWTGGLASPTRSSLGAYYLYAARPGAVASDNPADTWVTCIR